MSPLQIDYLKDNIKTASLDISGFSEGASAEKFVTWFKENFSKNFSFLLPKLRQLSGKGGFLRDFKEEKLNYLSDLITVSLGSSSIATVHICLERKMTLLHATVINKISNLCLSFLG